MDDKLWEPSSERIARASISGCGSAVVIFMGII